MIRASAGKGAKTGNRHRPREAALEISDLGLRQPAGVPGHERPLSDKVKAVGYRQAHYSGLPWCCTQSGMSEPAENVLGCHAAQRLAHGIIKPRPSPRLGSTDALLDLREHLLDRGVVRAVRR